MSNIARDVDKKPKVIADYFEILEDLLIAYRIYPFNRKGKRKTIKKPKFYFFDVGVYRSIRPTGPLDHTSDLNGHEVDFILYRKRGLHAIECKCSKKVSSQDLKSLHLFKKDFPLAQLKLIYAGDDRLSIDGVEIISVSI